MEGDVTASGPTSTPALPVARTRAQGADLDSRGAAAEWIAVAQLVPWDQNPKKPTPADIDGVVESITRFGFGAPIVARQANLEIIAGHTRFQAARKMGLAEVPVRLLDVSEHDAHLLALADNELGADNDPELLLDMLDRLKAEERRLVGFSEQAFAKMRREQARRTGGDDVGPTAPPEAPVSKPGERYELGPHVLVCGDSRAPAVWQLLLGGERVDLVWTDPPYGVAIVGGNHSLSPEQRRKRGGKEIQNDALSPEDLKTFLDAALSRALACCAPGASWYVAAPAGPLFAVFGACLSAMGVWRHTLVWLKDSLVMGHCDYHYRHEAIFYGWEPSAGRFWAGGRSQDSILEFPRPKRSTEHPTMKPPELIQRCITNSSKVDGIVADPFGGSGSTLIACARESRRARLIELDPRYCDVIRKRWGDFARSGGLTPGAGAL